MTLDVDPDLQYSLLEYVAHLTAEDYDKLPDDLVALGFLKPEKLEFASRSGVLEPLKYFLKQANQGGGATGVRDRIFEEYRAKYPGLDDDQLRVEMRSEMKVSYVRFQSLSHRVLVFDYSHHLFSATNVGDSRARECCYRHHDRSGRAPEAKSRLFSDP